MKLIKQNIPRIAEFMQTFRAKMTKHADLVSQSSQISINQSRCSAEDGSVTTSGYASLRTRRKS